MSLQFVQHKTEYEVNIVSQLKNNTVRLKLDVASWRKTFRTIHFQFTSSDTNEGWTEEVCAGGVLVTERPGMEFSL